MAEAACDCYYVDNKVGIKPGSHNGNGGRRRNLVMDENGLPNILNGESPPLNNPT